MNGETEDSNTPVRRSSRARKPNSRFADDELDGCIKKIVKGVSSLESPTSATSVNVTPNRQKKGGKKREVEGEEVESKPAGVKEVENNAKEAPPPPDTPSDVVNGALNEGESSVDSMGKTKSPADKPQERRTRSNAKGDKLESLPMEEKKRTGRKASRGRSKASEEEKSPAQSKSKVEKSTAEELKGEGRKKLSFEETNVIKAKSDKTCDKPQTKRENTDETPQSNVRDDADKSKNREFLEKSSEGGKEDNFGNEVTKAKEIKKLKDSEAEAKTPSGFSGDKVVQDDLKDKVVQDDLKDSSKMDSVSLGESCKTSRVSKSVSKEALEKLSTSTPERLSKKSNLQVPTTDENLLVCVNTKVVNQEIKKGESIETADTKSTKEVLSPSRKQKESPGKDLSPSRKQKESPGKDLSPSKKQKESPGKDLSPSKKQKESPGKDLSLSKKQKESPGKDLSPSKKQKESPGKEHCILSKGRKEIDFSEAQTSTPSHRRESSLSEEGTRTSNKEEQEENVKTLEVRKLSNTICSGLESSPIKPRAKNPRKPSRWSSRPENSEAENIDNIAKEDLTRDVKLAGLSQTVAGEKVSDQFCAQKGSITKFIQPQDHIKAIDNINVDEDKSSMECISESSRGKRNRSELLNADDFKDENLVMDSDKSPKPKKRKDGDTVSQEDDQKRKRQAEPDEDLSVRKRKRSENNNDGADASENIPLGKDVADLKCKNNEKGGSEALRESSSVSVDIASQEALTAKLTSEIAKDRVNEKSSSQEAPAAKLTSETAKDKVNEKSSSNLQINTDDDDESSVREKRQSSLGSILSLLKRPDASKKLEDGANKAFVEDRRSSEKKREDDERKCRVGDRRPSEVSRRNERPLEGTRRDMRLSEGTRRDERSSEGTRRDERSSEGTRRDERSSDGSRRDERSESMRRDERRWRGKDGDGNERREERFGGREKYNRDRKSDSFRDKQGRRFFERDSKEEYASRSGLDSEVQSTFKMGDDGNISWDAMIDMTPLVPLGQGSKVMKAPKTTAQVSATSETTCSEIVESDEAEGKRNSSIGNILSFLKRGGQSKQESSPLESSEGTHLKRGGQSKQESSPLESSEGTHLKRGDQSKQESSPLESSEGTHSTTEEKIFNLLVLKSDGQSKQESSPSIENSKGPHLTTEEKIFNLVESSRKSSIGKGENYDTFSKQEDVPLEKKSVVKSRERRVSKWSAREETSDGRVSRWESASVFQKKDSSNLRESGGSRWSEQQKPEDLKYKKWGDATAESTIIATTNKENTEHSLVDETLGEGKKSYGMWGEDRKSWKNWDDDQKPSCASSSKTYDNELTNNEVKDTSKVTKKSGPDDNVDFSKREGMSEFMESYADELDQSTEDVTYNRSQTTDYQNTEVSSARDGSRWHGKDEIPLSPSRDMYSRSRNKDNSSSPQERPWSPRSSEVPLSPKSRELMSSLMNMEVKLTPQVKDDVSAQGEPDHIYPKDTQYAREHTSNDALLPFKIRKDGASGYDNSPLPSVKDDSDSSFVKLLEPRQQETKGFRGARSPDRSQSPDESSWLSHTQQFVRSQVGSGEEAKKDVDAIRKGDIKEECLERKTSFLEENIDDKENLEPKVEDDEFLEKEKLEYQRKMERDLEAQKEKNKLVVEQRLKSFVHLKENLYLGDRKKSKRSKEVRRMVCDCSLTKEEIARDEVGCGEDCLNRLLMIECGSRCPLKERCTNKRFQNLDYADMEVFNAEEKGCGIRAQELIPAGTFIMEYVGEVFDSREFKRRKKEYSRNHNAHFYFMALKGDLFIDATRKGNIARFINHSCDPNAQTQKWTVNGELRVGFFAQKTIEAGEEINFDYRLERYGREPQRCYCGTAICRGWLGESPEEKTKEEKEEEKRQERDRRKREEKRSYVEDVDLEDEIEKLNTIKLRTRQDVLNLCRLMVRADNANSRVMLLRLLQSSTSACKRLFMDYHGLSLLWSWMADLGYAYEHASTKIEILKTLECLPITNKTQLTDSRVLGVVERWSTQSVEVPLSGSPPPPPPPRPRNIGSEAANQDSDSGKKSSDTSEDSDGEMDTKPVSAMIEMSSVDDVSMDSVDVEQEALKSKPNLEGCMAEDDSSDSNLSEEKKCAVEPGEGDTAAAATPEDEAASREVLILHKNMVELATKLLDLWKDLKEYFRIPKKERIELMKEHEREIEEEIRGLDRDRKDKDKYRRDFDRRRRSPDRDKDKERHSRRTGHRDPRDDKSSDSPKMSKEQRRQLFEIQVQQEEEAKQRKMQEEMWAMHVERCRLLGQDPYLTPIFDPTCQFYWDPKTAAWQPYNGTDPNLPVPASYGFRPGGEGDGSPMIVGIPPSHVIAAQPLTGHVASEGEAATPNYEETRIDPATIPLPGEITQTSPTQPLPCQAVPVEGTPPQGARVLTYPLSTEAGVALAPPNAVPINLNTNALTVPYVVGEEPPQPPPGPITIQLPPRWKMARDSEGHVYFYHVKSRTSQWEPPTPEQHQQLESKMGYESDSDSVSSDSDSSSTTDSEDFSSDEEEEEEEEQVTTVERGELCDEKMIRRHRAKKPRSEALVQERVISPVLEEDKEAARRERREAKERAQKEVRQERHEDRHHDTTSDLIDPNEEIEPLSEKILRMEKADSAVEKDRHEYRESRSKSRDKIKSKERAATAIADNSDSARKSKENFRAKMATYIVSVLNPYRREDCKIGRITCNEDFKYLARKLTHFVMIKELKQLHSVEDLECNDSVKYKTKDFVRKYMGKYGLEFKRDPTDTKEY